MFSHFKADIFKVLSHNHTCPSVHICFSVNLMPDSQPLSLALPGPHLRPFQFPPKWSAQCASALGLPDTAALRPPVVATPFHVLARMPLVIKNCNPLITAAPSTPLPVFAPLMPLLSASHAMTTLTLEGPSHPFTSSPPSCCAHTLWITLTGSPLYASSLLCPHFDQAPT